MILIAYRHGLRVSELCDLQWNQIDFQSAAIHIRRVKRGTPATHPLTGNEMRALRKLKSENEASPFVFVSELGTPFTAMGFSQMLKRAAEKAGLGIKVHAHMLRHACGFKLANDGVDTRSLQSYLGHKNIQQPSAIRNYHQIGSRIFGRIKATMPTSFRKSPGAHPGLFFIRATKVEKGRFYLRWDWTQMT